MRFLTILVVLAVIAAGVFEWANSAWDGPGLPAQSGDQTVVLVAPHTPTHAIGQLLEQKIVIKSGLMFELDLRLKGMTGKLKAGEYAIPSRASMHQIADILSSGRGLQHKLTAAEGLTSDMIWKLVQKDDVLTGDAGPVPAEGSLLPETYLFTRGETRIGLLEKMHAAQLKFLSQHWRGAANGIATQRQALILASIVEKESALPRERRHIAGVFLNRLRIGMRLQTDPTIIYGITRGYPLGRGIRASELAAATPYNTYVITGLPPGPISNPGKDSIAAVLDPEITGDLYFVADGSGGHVFSATIAEHARNVAHLRLLESQAAHQVQDPGRIAPPDVSDPQVAVPMLPARNPAKTHRHRRPAK